MTLKELKAEIDAAIARGYGELPLVFRDGETEPDPDIAEVYVDEECKRFVLRGFYF